MKKITHRTKKEKNENAIKMKQSMLKRWKKLSQKQNQKRRNKNKKKKRKRKSGQENVNTHANNKCVE